MQSVGQKRKSIDMHGTTCSVDRKTGTGMMGMPSAEDDVSDDEQDASPAKGSAMPRVRVGNRHLQMHSELIEMTDSTDLYKAGNFLALRERLESDGFLFLRGVMPRETVQRARTKMLQHLRDKGAIRQDTEWEQAYIEYQTVWDAKQQAAGRGTPSKKRKSQGGMASVGMASMGMANCKPATPAAGGAGKKMIPGWVVDAESGGIIGGREPDEFVAGWREIGNSKELRDVYDGAALHSFYQHLFSQDVSYRAAPHLSAAHLPPYTALPNCTWLRAKGPGEVTAEHADYYYFYKNTSIFGDYFTPTEDEAKKVKQERGNKEDKMTDAEKETCQLCHDTRDPERTLICELCGRGFHIDCLRPVVSELPPEEQEWHCYDCCNLAMDYWTCWTPMADLSGYDGRLALIAGSHRLKGYEDPIRADLLPKGFSKQFEQRAVWQTPTTIGMGDIILFNIKTIHAATRNGSEKFRLSLDTRVTTCKGNKYLHTHHIPSLLEAHINDTRVNTAKQKRSAAVVPATGAKERAVNIDTFFQQRKVS